MFTLRRRPDELEGAGVTRPYSALGRRRHRLATDNRYGLCGFFIVGGAGRAVSTSRSRIDELVGGSDLLAPAVLREIGSQGCIERTEKVPVRH